MSLVVRQRKAKSSFQRDNKSFHTSWTPICTVVKLCLPMLSTDYACASDIQKEINITVFVSLPVRQECAVNIIWPCHFFIYFLHCALDNSFSLWRERRTSVLLPGFTSYIRFVPGYQDSLPANDNTARERHRKHLSIFTIEMNSITWIPLHPHHLYRRRLSQIHSTYHLHHTERGDNGLL